MSFKLISNLGQEVPYTRSLFSGGEIQTRLDPEQITNDSMNWKQVAIIAHMRIAGDIMELAMLANSLTRNCQNRPRLVMPYVPYARQDRVCQVGEDFALDTFAKIVNLCNFEEVIVWDVHSVVAQQKINRLINVEAYKFVNQIKFSKLPVVVAPDKGAIDRAKKVQQAIGSTLIQALKVRAVDNSSVSIQLEDPNIEKTDQDFLIVDDICDGGRTFLELAKVLRPLTVGKILLYVTHGIFSNRGIAVFDNIIDEIYCPNIWSSKGWDPYYKVKLNRIGEEHEVISRA